jgi:hypothetical protein
VVFAPVGVWSPAYLLQAYFSPPQLPLEAPTPYPNEILYLLSKLRGHWEPIRMNPRCVGAQTWHSPATSQTPSLVRRGSHNATTWWLGFLQVIKDHYTEFLLNKCTRLVSQKHKLDLCVEFPTEFLEFIAKQRSKPEHAKRTLMLHDKMP